MQQNIEIILTSVDNREAANSMADALVEKGLAACVQISAAGQSVYRWQGETMHDAEYYLCIKTSRARANETATWLTTHHPYDEPEIVRLDGEASPGYLAWLETQTRHPG
ncbi:MAG TPA: divalent-cation tolerance protein CutA [Mariprofundaceae bacterium]|nr:divalent-cation tolerance protein CutA [Mariprofundaceae bacterium]